jgi:hypothetical protein
MRARMIHSVAAQVGVDGTQRERQTRSNFFTIWPFKKITFRLLSDVNSTLNHGVDAMIYGVEVTHLDSVEFCDPI